MRKIVLPAVLIATVAVPSATAQTGLEPRVDKLEREMRAVQRTVFPGGAGKYVAPDITAATPATAMPGTPATSPVADLDARVATLERQQQSLTGQIEQTQFKLRQLEDAFAAYRRSTDTRLAGGETTAPAPLLPDAAATPTPKSTPRPGATATPKPGADADRASRLAAIQRPSSADPAEDSYFYGYRLWEAKLYPEAEVALKDTVAKYPKARRASYAQNLLGRAYMDEGRLTLAAGAFLDSFKKFPDGERAPDSLYFLGQVMTKLNKPADACKVYAELDASYGTKLGPDLKAKADKGRADARCK